MLGRTVAMQTVLSLPRYLPNVAIRKLVKDEPYVYPIGKWMFEQFGSEKSKLFCRRWLNT